MCFASYLQLVYLLLQRKKNKKKKQKKNNKKKNNKKEIPFKCANSMIFAMHKNRSSNDILFLITKNLFIHDIKWAKKKKVKKLV